MFEELIWCCVIFSALFFIAFLSLQFTYRALILIILPFMLLKVCWLVVIHGVSPQGTESP